MPSIGTRPEKRTQQDRSRSCIGRHVPSMVQLWVWTLYERAARGIPGMTMLSGRIGNEETCPARATDAFQGFSQREVSYLLTYTCGRSGQAKEAHAADQSELITLILALVPPQGQCRVYIVNTTDYPGCPDSDDRLRHIVEGGVLPRRTWWTR